MSECTPQNLSNQWHEQNNAVQKCPGLPSMEAQRGRAGSQPAWQLCTPLFDISSLERNPQKNISILVRLPPGAWRLSPMQGLHGKRFGNSPSHQLCMSFWRRSRPVFRSSVLPILSLFSGKVIMETRSRIAAAPDGNGGVYLALQRSGMLQHMSDHNVECLDCFSVDNLLARVCDPQFIGCCHSRQTLCGSRAVGKAYPEERVSAPHPSRVSWLVACDR